MVDICPLESGTTLLQSGKNKITYRQSWTSWLCRGKGSSEDPFSRRFGFQPPLEIEIASRARAGAWYYSHVFGMCLPRLQGKSETELIKLSSAHCVMLLLFTPWLASKPVDPGKLTWSGLASLSGALVGHSFTPGPHNLTKFMPQRHLCG